MIYPHHQKRARRKIRRRRGVTALFAKLDIIMNTMRERGITIDRVKLNAFAQSVVDEPVTLRVRSIRIPYRTEPGTELPRTTIRFLQAAP